MKHIIIAPEDGARLLAVYTTAGRARQSLHVTAMNFRLCPKLMGLEKTRRACFQSQLGKCDGACEGLETAASYNERFLAAFDRQRVVAHGKPEELNESTDPQVRQEIGLREHERLREGRAARGAY